MIEMVTLDEVKEVGQLGAREHLLQYARDARTEAMF